MRNRKSLLWLMLLPYCAFCMAEGTGIVPEKAPQAAAAASPKEKYDAALDAIAHDDMSGAIILLKPAATAGDAASQALMAYVLDKSSFSDDAAVYYRKSADQGNADGEFGLGQLYAEGSGVKQDNLEARRLITSAAQKGNKRAIFTLAQVYIKGGLGLTEAERKAPEALTWIRRSAENDDVVSIDALAAAYTSGHYGITPDPKQAADLTAKANKLRGLDAKGKRKK